MDAVNKMRNGCILNGGILVYYVVSLIVAQLMKNVMPGYEGTISSCFLQIFYLVFLFPLFFNWVEKRYAKV